MAKTKPVREREASKGPRQARGRMVSRSIATSEQLARVSLLADYLFRACIPFLDATGRMTGNPYLIKSQVLPLRDEISAGVIPELLRSLSNSVDHDGIPLVFWYEINGAKVLEFPKFSEHQTGLRADREAPSKFPPRNGLEKLLSESGPTPDGIRNNSGVGPAQEEVEVEVEVEVEGEVVKSEQHAHTNGADPSRDVPPSNSAAHTHLIAALEQLAGPDRFAPMLEFLQRRKHATWTAWIREMLKLVGPGSQFTPDDLASVCADDAALDDPIAGPFALRSFLATARRERLKPADESRPPTESRPAPSQRGSHGEATYAAALAALDDVDDSPEGETPP